MYSLILFISFLLFSTFEMANALSCEIVGLRGCILNCQAFHCRSGYCSGGESPGSTCVCTGCN